MTSSVNSEFEFTQDFTVTSEVKHAFEENGYIILRNLLGRDEVSKLKDALENEQGVIAHAYGRDDGHGRRSKTVLWNHPGNDLTGVVARSEKLAGTFEKLLGGEVYHYHAKVILKEAKTGGAHPWHQDYGYWYENGCLFPNMGTVWVAVDKAEKENGCVQFLSGSHKAGRIDHIPVGEHVGADPERKSQIERTCPLRYCELDPGDAMFFHCNVLHHSAQNSSEKRRWGFLVSYNRADNNPVKKHHHPFYTRLEKVPDSAIMECTDMVDMSGKDFFRGPIEDVSLQSTLDKKAK